MIDCCLRSAKLSLWTCVRSVAQTRTTKLKHCLFLTCKYLLRQCVFFICEDFVLWYVMPCSLMALYFHLQSTCPGVGGSILLWNINTFLHPRRQWSSWSSLLVPVIEKQIALLFSFSNCIDLCLVSVLKLRFGGVFTDEQHITDTFEDQHSRKVCMCQYTCNGMSRPTSQRNSLCVHYKDQLLSVFLMIVIRVHRQWCNISRYRWYIFELFHHHWLHTHTHTRRFKSRMLSSSRELVLRISSNLKEPKIYKFVGERWNKPKL
jgi:hypothetical protein